ncbi:MAG TPA: hypothetical protein VM369_08135 [Candidatus Binatia bacterium]|nr:hypothetical protein [Candidatus Binatia bacterium]
MKMPVLLYPMIGVVLLVVLFVLFKPAPAPAPAPEAVAEVATAPAEPVQAAPAPKIFELVVKDGHLESGPSTLSVTQGDEVLLRVTADRADQLHLHGYDLHVALVPGTPAELRFTADRSGRFDFELHHANVELGALEVQPKS